MDPLLACALAARENAHAPFSNFKVGAAIEDANGRIHTGCNVENATYGLTVCAERVALFKALTNGVRDFVAIAVVARVKDGPMPCGACRQLLAEYAPEAIVFVGDAGHLEKIRRYPVKKLLPLAFLGGDW